MIFIKLTLCMSIISRYQHHFIEFIFFIAREIITLRNHYVHNGYYIDNHCLTIKYHPSETIKNIVLKRILIIYIYIAKH